MSSSKKFLSIDEILAAPDVQYAEVQAWGSTVRLGSLSAGDMIDFVEANDGPAKKTAGLRLIISSLVNEEGVRIGKPEHLAVFKQKDARTCNKLVEAILTLNGLNPKETTAVKTDSSEAASVASPTS
jgi:hypothetical protein